MCQSYKRRCACGERTSELFFGRNVLNESAVLEVYCPKCAGRVDAAPESLVHDNGWVLQLDPDIYQSMAKHMALEADSITAEQVFSGDFVTWVGFAPEDSLWRAQEQEAIANETKGDRKAHFLALREWAQQREARLADEGWRKAKRSRG